LKLEEKGSGARGKEFWAFGRTSKRGGAQGREVYLQGTNF